jgi:hypothetical protein
LLVECIPEGKNRVTLKHIPDHVQIEENNFELLCATLLMHEAAHFISILKINRDQYIMDDMKNGLVYLPPVNFLNRQEHDLNKVYELGVSTALYFAVN